ncbi:MAG: hypothetical protein AAGF20_00100 [Pseudomonadota bacterium]
MANADAPRGFIPRRHKNGAPYSGACKRYYVASGESNDLFIGDPVDLSGSGDAAGVPGVQQPAGQNVIGVIVGVENLTSDNLSRTYRPASTAMYVMVADDPDLEFEIQEDSTGGALAAADIGLNADFVIGTGDTTFGTSAAEIDSSTKATTATLGLRILELAQREDNEIGTNANWLVKFNLHRHNNATGA